MEQEPSAPLPPGGSEVYEGAQALTSEGPGLNSHLHQAPGGKLGGLSCPHINPTGHCEDSQKGARQFPATAVFFPTLPAQSTLPEYCNKQLSLNMCSRGWFQDLWRYKIPRLLEPFMCVKWQRALHIGGAMSGSGGLTLTV